MRKNFLNLFKNKKPICAMLHLKGESHEEILAIAKKEIDIYIKGGVDAIIIENYFSHIGRVKTIENQQAEVEKVLSYISEQNFDMVFGINFLGDDEINFKLAKKYNVDFLQIDSISGHLAPDKDKEFGEFIRKFRSECDVCVIGGVRFKYQPYNSGRSLEEDLKIGMQRCDAIAVTGNATGEETDMEKIKSFKEIVGDFPLVVAAGVTYENCYKQLEIGDAAIVGSYFKDTYKDTGDVCFEHVEKFIKNISKIR
jgi:uncharacterized protein